MRTAFDDLEGVMTSSDSEESPPTNHRIPTRSTHANDT